jgi:hypothetical protein
MLYYGRFIDAIEVISGQTFGEMPEKATDYLAAGISCWVVDPRAKSVSVFLPDASPKTYRGNRLLETYCWDSV